MKIAVNVPDGPYCKGCLGLDDGYEYCDLFHKTLSYEPFDIPEFVKCQSCLDAEIKVQEVLIEYKEEKS